MSYAVTKLRAWAVFTDANGNSKQIDIVRLMASYQRNSIPTTTLTVPLGKEVESWQQSNVHLLAPGAMDRIFVHVFVQGIFGGSDWQPAAGARPIVPVGVQTFLLFAGWLTGIDYNREREKVNAELEVTHWLSDLNSASALCQSSCPSNPASLIFKADGLVPINPGADAGANAAAREYVTAEALQKDFWSKGLFRWIDEWMLATDRLFETEFGQGMNDSSDGLAKIALNRMQTSTNAKLNFNLGEAVQLIHDGIINDLIQNVTDVDGEERGLANITIWEKLVGHLVPTYHFDIIPRPLDALIRPVVPAYRYPYVTILARDQAILKSKAGLKRPIRAVGLFHGDYAGDIISQVDEDTAANLNVFGFYEAQAFGLVLFRQAPRFLVTGDVWGRTYTEFVDVYSDIINGNRGVRGRHKVAGGRLADATFLKMSVANRMALMMYLEEALKERAGVVVGPLRFDVCPGSTICVQGAADVGTCYALVQGVNYFIDSEQQQVATAFQLGYIRSETENPQLASTYHPLYEDTWAGDAMAPEIT